MPQPLHPRFCSPSACCAFRSHFSCSLLCCSKGGSYSIPTAANAAGFYNDLGMDALSLKEDSAGSGVVFVHAAPGFVNTNWGTEMPWYIRWPVRAMQVGTSSLRAHCAKRGERAEPNSKEREAKEASGKPACFHKRGASQRHQSHPTE